MATPMETDGGPLLKISQSKANFDKLQGQTFEVLKRNVGIEQSGALKTELLHLMGQYKKLKRWKIIPLQAKLKFMEFLQSGEFPDCQQAEAELKQSRSNVEKCRMDMEDQRATLQELGEAIENHQKEYQQKLDQLQERLKQAEEKQHHFEEVQAKHKEIVAGFEGLATAPEVKQLLQQRDAKLKSVMETLSKLEVAIETGQAEAARLKAECEEMEKAKSEIQSLINDLGSRKTEADQHAADNIKWCEDTLTLMRDLGGIKDLKVDGTSATVVFANTDGNSDKQELQLTMHFGAGLMGRHILKAAEVNVNTLEVSDLIKTAVDNDDISYLVAQIQARWQQHHPLLHEIEALRERYPLDWLHKEGLLRVLYREDAHIACTLHIQEGSAPGTITISVQSIEGIKLNMPLEDMKPAMENPSLTQWLEFLQCYFETNHAGPIR